MTIENLEPNNTIKQNNDFFFEDNEDEHGYWDIFGYQVNKNTVITGGAIIVTGIAVIALTKKITGIAQTTAPIGGNTNKSYLR